MSESSTVAKGVLDLKASTFSSKLSTFTTVVTGILFVWFLMICWGAVRLLSGHGQGLQYCVKPQADCDPGIDGKIKADCLYECPSPENMAELVSALESSNGLTRRGALASLNDTIISDTPQKDQLVAALGKLLSDPDPYTRIKAAQVLRSVGTPSAQQALAGFVATHHRPSAAGREFIKQRPLP